MQMKNLQELYYFDSIIWVFQSCGLNLWPFSLSCMCPHAFKDLEAIFHIMLMRDHDAAVLCTPMPFCRVESGSLLGWSVSIAGWDMWLHALCMRLFSWDFNHAGCPAIRLVNWTVPWFTPMKMGPPHLIGLLWAQSHPPIKLTLGTPTLSPAAKMCLHSNQSILPPPPCKQKGKWLLGVENNWGTRTSRGVVVIFKWCIPLGGHNITVWAVEGTECFVR